MGKQKEAALSRLQSHLIWMPMMPPCGWRAETVSFPQRPSWNETGRRGCSYLDGHVLEAVPRILHYLAKTEYGAEGICASVVNARIEVVGGDVGKNVPPEVGRKQKTEASTISKKGREFLHIGELTQLATTYLLKLNLGYQMLFLTKRVKFSAAFKKAGLKKIL